LRIFVGEFQLKGDFTETKAIAKKGASRPAIPFDVF